MKEALKRLIFKLRLDNTARKLSRSMIGKRKLMLQDPPYGNNLHNKIINSNDPIRNTAIALAINTLDNNKIEGSFAEVGVYRGETSKIIHSLAPHRKLYLFDTFEGFPAADLKQDDDRFKDTNLEIVKKNLGNLDNVHIKKGYFPETTSGIEEEQFSFVLLDMDLYKPTKAGLDFFYPRTVSGGYIFIHDFNSTESNGAVSKVVKKYMKDKPEHLIEIPDTWGSIVFRKL
jgi:O-methyltransferase